MIKQSNFESNSIQIGSNNVIKGSNIISGPVIIDGIVIVDGVQLPPPPTCCNNVTIVNNNVYIDGYEFKNGKWKKTLRAWWHLWF